MKKIILPAVFIILIAVVFAPGFLIKAKVVCKSQHGDCPDQITESLKSLDGEKLYFARKDLKKNLKSNFLVSAFTIQFKLPNILKVDLIVKKAAFALHDGGSGNIALVDKEGTVLTYGESTGLPEVLVAEALPAIGNSVSERNLTALNIMQGIFKMYQIRTGHIEGDTLLVDLPGAIRVIFPLAGFDTDKLLGSVRLIYTNIRDSDSGKNYSQIDLRYKNPVLR